MLITKLIAAQDKEFTDTLTEDTEGLGFLGPKAGTKTAGRLAKFKPNSIKESAGVRPLGL